MSTMSVNSNPISFADLAPSSNSSTHADQPNISDSSKWLVRDLTTTNQNNINVTHELSVSHNQLRIASINFQSISNKVSSFHEFIHSYDPDIILGCESWLTADVFSNEIFPSNYNINRKYRHNKQRDGVFVCYKDTISCQELHSNNTCEAVVC